MPFSFECTVGGGRVDGYSGVLSYALEGAARLSGLLGEGFEVLGLDGWEFIGRAFNLYSYRLGVGSGEVGQLRVVEKGGRVLGVFGVLSRLPGAAAPGSGLVASEGEVLGRPVLLREPPREDGGEVHGQRVVSRWPIYAVEGLQPVEPGWRVRVEGLVGRVLDLSLGELVRLGEESSRGDFHCVTGWSVRGRTWEGVRLSAVLEMAGLLPGAGWIAGVSSGGYAAVFPLEYAREALLVLRVDGAPLRREEGAPVRLFTPPLYGWKHVKWLRRIVVLGEYEDGYWEALAYHERGLVSTVERFKVRNLEVAEAGRLPEGRRMLRPPGV